MSRSVSILVVCLLVAPLAGISACGGPAQESEPEQATSDESTGDQGSEPISSEDFESGEVEASTGPGEAADEGAEEEAPDG